MKRSAIAVASAVMLAAVLSACGGSGGGGGGGGVGGGYHQLATGTFTKTVNLGGSSNNAAPFTNAPSSRTQHLYLASDIKGSGNLQSIIFTANTTTTIATTCSNVVVKAGHSLLTGLTTTFDANLNSGSTQTVYSGAVTIPAMSSGATYTLTFNEPFEYNGVDNLILDFKLSAACSPYFIISSATAATNRSLFATPSTASTGSLSNYSPNLKFTFAGGDNAVELGGTSSSSAPFGTNLFRQQMVYLASEIHGSGAITGLGFKTAATTTTGSYTYTLKLGHTTLSSLSTTTFANNFNSGSPTTVVSNGTFTIPGGVPAGAYMWIPFPGTFTYNGTDNLIVDLDVSSGSVDNSIRYTSVGTARLAYASSGSAKASGTVTYVFDTKFRFNGGTMDVVTAENDEDILPFYSGGSSKRQFFYPSTMLGTKGSISKLALRLTYDSAAGTYDNFEVVLGHTTLEGLTGTLADNLTDATTVYRGTFAIPAGLKAGDWIEIPFSHHFAYDGVRNLVVQIASDQGTVTNCIATDGPSAAYTGYHLYAFPREATAAGSINNYIADQRLWIEP